MTSGLPDDKEDFVKAIDNLQPELPISIMIIGIGHNLDELKKLDTLEKKGKRKIVTFVDYSGNEHTPSINVEKAIGKVIQQFE